VNKDIISKELLSEVLCIEYPLESTMSSGSVRLIYYNKNDKQTWKYDENIHVLAHKCKEWAKSKHFIIVSALIDEEEKARAKVKYSSLSDAFLDKESEYFITNTEPEAIFKACQWVLDNKED